MGKCAKSSDAALLSESPRARATRALRKSMEAGRLQPGDELASELSLAENLNVSRGTIRAALADLESEGLVRLDGRRRVITEPGPVRTLPPKAVLIVSCRTDAEASAPAQPRWGAYLHYGLISRFHLEGYSPLVVSPDRFASGQEQVDAASLHGLVAFPDSLRNEAALSRLQDLRSAGLAVVVGDPAETKEFDVVCSDHESGSFQATQWLIEHGCRRILRWWALGQHTRSRPGWLAARDTGYQRAVRDAGLDALDPVEYHTLGARAGQSPEQTLRDNVRLTAGYLAERLRDDPDIDALLLSTDLEVRSVAAALELCGRRGGQDPLIAGYDNCWADLPDRATHPVAPSITVDKRSQAIGEELAMLLLQRAAGELPDKPQVRIIEPELIVLDDAPLAVRETNLCAPGEAAQ